MLDKETLAHMDRMLLVKRISDQHPKLSLLDIYQQVMNGHIDLSSYLKRGKPLAQMKLEEAKIEGKLTRKDVEEAIAEYLKARTGKDLVKAEPDIQQVYEYDDGYPCREASLP